ncbi:hypothetical protein [Nocardia sp. NPDC020380]|uniref:hypothetical protein n=1 Tax=Nocardia sp. NPDC020380 TaxID=3364309 RepID=UPI00379891B2
MVIHYTNFGNFGDDWEDESTPVPPPRRAPQPPPIRPSDNVSQTSPLPGSSSVAMEVDNGLLPVRLQFANNWNYQVQAHEVGRELLKAYNSAAVRHLTHLNATAGGRLSPDYPHAHFVSRRQRISLLLEAETWDEYRGLQDELFATGHYRVNGQATQNDEPVVTISGSRESIRSFRVWSQWWGCADPYAIEAEIMACVAKIRAAQPKFTLKRDWSNYTDEQLSELKRDHQRRLIESSVY